MRPVILFDVMDTLVYNPFNAEIPKFFGVSQSRLLAEKRPDSWLRFEAGEIDQAEYLRDYFSDSRDFDHDAFLETVEHAYRWIDGAEELLKHLSDEGFEIHALSNYPIWYRTIEAKLRLSRYLRWTFVSCLTGIRKPAPEAFLSAAQDLNRAVADCLFIDDHDANCRAAESVGLPSIVFSDMRGLSAELRRRGLID